jgi:hypothetical protein
MNDIEEVLARTQKHAVDYLISLDQRPVNATATLTDLRRRLDVPLGLVRFLDSRPNATAADHDARTDWAIEAINREGTAFFSGTTWKGHRAMRTSVVNWRTSARDVERTLKAVAAVLASDHMK